MLIAERREMLLSLIKDRNYATIAEICNLLHFSESTVRRDLKKLEHENLIRLTRGGCVYNDHPNLETPQTFRQAVHLSAKRPIARRAADMVKDNQIIMLDCSTTTMEMIPYLSRRQNLTVITNCLTTASLVAQTLDCTLLCTGGRYSAPNASFVGFAAENTLRSWHADLAFVSVNSIHPVHGLTDQGDEIAHIKSVMFEQSRRSILLADASKFGSLSNYVLEMSDRITDIITNADPRFDDPEWARYRPRMIFV